MTSKYRESGVDIDASNRAKEEIGKLVRATWGEEVLSEVGNFGGLFELSTRFERPVLVSSADWRCRVTFVLNPPTTRDALEKSPHGVYVESYHWEAVPSRNAPARPGTQANRGGNG